MHVKMKAEPAPARSQDAADTATLRKSLKVLIVDDHPIVASACRAMFAADPDVVIIDAFDAESGEAIFAMERPDVCVLDINLPGVSGFELARRILAKSPHERIIMFSMHDDPVFAKRAIEAGTKGYVSKCGDPTELVCAIREVASGRVFMPSLLANKIAFGGSKVASNRLAKLTAREIEILRLLTAGNRLAEIALSTNVSYNRIVNASAIIRRKLGLRTSAEMVRLAVEEKLV
jgi:two-component system, NarL family, invasion response regulator UvrY